MIQDKQKISTPFMSIEDAATFTGLSQYYLRKGIRKNEIPHICCGTTYKVNVPKLLDQMGVPYEPVKL